MVEASMIFPLVIAAVMAVIYIVIGLYSSLSLQTSLHLALRRECGESSKTVYRLDDIKEFQSDKDSVDLRTVLVMDEEREYQIKGIFANKITRKETGRSYVIDDTEIVRLRSIAKEGS